MGLIIDMTNKDALITKAMLASYISEKGIDYLEMIAPFILRTLPKIGEQINIEAVTQQINENYGLDIKQKIVIKILNRFCKNDHDNIIRRESSQKSSQRGESGERRYYVNKKIENEKFDKRKERMKDAVQKVVSRLRDYINENYCVLKPITDQEAQEFFLNFLKDYNLELYSTVDSLRKIQRAEKNSSNNFRVAKFILHEHELKEEGCYKQIENIQEGYFASAAIYYFCNSDGNENPNKIIDQTKIFLDTRLLIDFLGFNRESEAKSMMELVSLIKKGGGKLCTFDYYVDELCGIIHKFRTDSSARLTLDLDYFRRKKTNNAELAVVEKRIYDALTERGIDIVKDFDFDSQVKNQTWHIDSLELKRNMNSLISYSGGSSAPAFINDLTTLERVSYCKYESEKQNGYKAIFVTTNSGLVKAAKMTFKEPFFKKGLEAVISDIDLAATLWLNSYNEGSKLSSLILLENAYAAICPNKDILTEVLRIIEDGINGSDKESREEALMLRANNNLLEDIAEVTENNLNEISPDIMNKLFDKMKKDISKSSYDEAYHKLYNDVYDKAYEDAKTNVKEKFTNKYNSEIQKKMEEIELKDKHVQDITEENEKVKEINDIQRGELENKKEENEKLKMENTKMKQLEEKRLRKIAFKVQCVFKYTLYGISFLTCYLISYNMLRVICGPSLLNVFGNNRSELVNVIYNLVSMLVSMCSVFKWMKNIILKWSNYINDYVYQALIRKSEIL